MSLDKLFKGMSRNPVPGSIKMLERSTSKMPLWFPKFIDKINYNNVQIEVDKSDNLKRLYENIKERGNSKIKIFIKQDDKSYLFELKDKRKFDYETLKYLNKEHYIKKITV